MGKRELKLLNKDLEISLVDMINKFDVSKTAKYTGFLIKLFREKQKKENGLVIPFVRHNDSGRPRSENLMEDQILYYLTDFFGQENLELLRQFDHHLKNERIDIERRDINKYNSWDDIRKEVSLASLKTQSKALEKQVLKFKETDEWVFIRPLTFEASLSYGAGTKWCTASRNNPDYFYRYSRNILFYGINKKTGNKYGFHYIICDDELSIWDEVDRRMDSFQTGVDFSLLKEIFDYIRVEKPNVEYFSNQEKERFYIYIEETKTEPTAIMGPGDWDGFPMGIPVEDDLIVNPPNYTVDYIYNNNTATTTGLIPTITLPEQQ